MKVTLIVLIALAVSAGLGKRSAAVRHWVLAMGLLCAGLAPFFGMVLPAWHPIKDAPAMLSTPQEPTLPAASTSVEFPTPSAGKVASASPTTSRFSLEGALLVIWAAGTIGALLVLFAGLCRLAWLASHARRVSDPRWTGLLGRVALLQSAHPSLLVTWGLFRPKIVLPASADEWSDDRMRIVLWHELSHIRRGDWFVQMLAEILRAAYWFNPIVWLAARRLRQESEQACDDEVMSLGVEGSDYATELVALARDLRQPRRTLFSGFPAPAMARPSSLGRRVSAMLDSRIDRRPLSATARLATIAVLLLVAIPIATAQSFATFSGTVVDATGRPIPQVSIIVTAADKQSKHEVLTTAAGTFQVLGLLPGTYEMSAQIAGFRSIKETLTLEPAQKLERRLELTIGSLMESVTVMETDAAAPQKVTAAVRPAGGPASAKACEATETGGNIRPPKKLKDFAPEYPAALRGTGTRGVVILSATIGVDGYVKDVEVLREANPDLALAAVTAVREWEYSQTLLNCSPVDVKMTITVNFTDSK
jgi:TonB family protein